MFILPKGYNILKKKRKRYWSNRKIRDTGKIAKYGIFKFRGFYDGDFEKDK